MGLVDKAFARLRTAIPTAPCSPKMVRFLNKVDFLPVSKAVEDPTSPIRLAEGKVRWRMFKNGWGEGALKKIKLSIELGLYDDDVGKWKTKKIRSFFWVNQRGPPSMLTVFFLALQVIGQRQSTRLQLDGLYPCNRLLNQFSRRE